MEETGCIMLDDETRLHFPSSGSAELPLLFEPQLLRCRAAGPAGHGLNVLLDTGTDPSAIDLKLARRLGLRLGEFALGQDATSNTVPFTETVLPWLRLGDIQLRNLFALAVDLSGAPFEVDVVLGYNVLRQVVLHVDYCQRKLSLSHPDLGGTALAAADVLLPLTFFEHFPALTDVLLDETLLLPLVTIDTGSNGGLTLGPDLAARLGLRPDAARARPGQGSGFYSTTDTLVSGQASMLQVGPFELHNIALDTPGSSAGDLGRTGRANMGNRLLSRFACITLDYERAVCGFTQRAAAQVSRSSSARK
jgi:hypothetical protein